MTVDRDVVRMIVASLVVLSALVLGCTGVAMAAAPNVAIVAPVAGELEPRTGARVQRHDR